MAGPSVIDPTLRPPDPALAGRLDPVLALTEGLLPWRRTGAATVVLAADPVASAHRHLPRLEALFGPVRLASAAPERLADVLVAVAARPLVAQAERRRPAPLSCRSLPGAQLGRLATAAATTFLALALLAPLTVFAALALMGAVILLISGGLRFAAAWAALHRDRPDEQAWAMPASLPMISLLVPLYREREVASSLLRHMETLDYPRDRLDLCLVVEDDDALTRATLGAARLPPWARIIEVPERTIRTKPRALNYALNFARGSIIGIYDAEDVPAPDHLLRVAATFARRSPATACLQGVLDYHNGGRNWIARCFTLEYAGWFRVLLPGLERLGLALPLGGTTLFLRRDALEAVGGWDAHNVTEDADLGILLARRGFQTEMIPIVTQEEANARLWPWVRQRSRWLKGYAITWAVHMRAPRALWRDLGPRRFWGFQTMFLGSLLQIALAPVLWSFWLVPLGLPHPIAALLPPALLVALSILFLATLVLDLSYAVMGARRAGKASLALWAPTLVAYFPLATLALAKALWEVARRPFHWDKTAHGLDRVAPLTRPPAPSPHPAGDGS